MREEKRCKKSWLGVDGENLINSRVDATKRTSTAIVSPSSPMFLMYTYILHSFSTLSFSLVSNVAVLCCICSHL